MRTRPWQIAVALIWGVLLVLALFAPSSAFGVVAFLPLVLMIGWAVWVVALLHGIREELRGLRNDMAGRATDDQRTER